MILFLILKVELIGLFTQHCVRFARARLAVGEEAHLVATNSGSGQRSELVEYLQLGRVRPENGVELELLVCSADVLRVQYPAVRHDQMCDLVGGRQLVLFGDIPDTTRKEFIAVDLPLDARCSPESRKDRWTRILRERPR